MGLWSVGHYLQIEGFSDSMIVCLRSMRGLQSRSMPVPTRRYGQHFEQRCSDPLGDLPFLTITEPDASVGRVVGANQRSPERR